MANNIDIVFRGNLRIATAQAKEDLAKIQADINAMQKSMGGGTGGIATQLQRELDQRKAQLAASVAAPMVQGVKTAANQIPPILKKAMVQAQTGGDWRNLIAGALVGGTNPFLGARFITSFFRGIGGGGGGGGGAFSAGGLFGGSAGQNLAMALAWKSLRAVTEALRYSFEQLVHTVQQAAKLYEAAARIGHTPFRQGVLQESLSAIGIEPSILQQLQLYAEFPTKRGRGGRGGTSTSVSNEILRSGRGVLQQGELQQIQNLSKYLDQFVKESQLAGRVFQDTSKQLFETEFAFSGLKREWKTLWTELAFTMSSILKPAIRGLGAALHLVNFAIENSVWFKLAQLISAKPGNEFSQAFGGSALKGLPVSQFQRIGFGMGTAFGGPNTEKGLLRSQLDILQKIEQNTNPNKSNGRVGIMKQGYGPNDYLPPIDLSPLNNAPG